jgi:hypothetical protein
LKRAVLKRCRKKVAKFNLQREKKGTMDFTDSILVNLTQQFHSMTTQLRQTEKILRVLGGGQTARRITGRVTNTTTKPKHGTMSAAGRRAISLATKARWAKLKRQKGIGLVGRKAA